MTDRDDLDRLVTDRDDLDLEQLLDLAVRELAELAPLELAWRARAATEALDRWLEETWGAAA